MTQNTHAVNNEGLTDICRSRGFIAALFIILLIFIGTGTLVNIAVIFKTRRAEFGAGHDMLGKAMQQQNQEESSDHPDDIKTTDSKDNRSSRITDSKINRVFSRIHSYTTVIEKQFRQKLIGSQMFVDEYGRFFRFIGKKTIATPNHSVLRTEQEFIYLTRFPFECELPPNREQIEPFFGELKTYLDERQIKFLCMVTLTKGYPLSFYKSDEDYRENIGLNNICSELEKLGIAYFDCFAELKKSCVDKEQWFYRTDHHWNIESVFKLMPALVNRLNQDFGFHFPNPDELYREQNFKSFQFPKFFLGSTGRKVGKYFVPADDFSYYIPAFPTDFQLDIVTTEYQRQCREGSFEETIVFDKWIKPKNVWKNRYAVYWGDDYPECDILNKDAASGRALVVKDSSSLPVTAFLSLVFKEIKMVDFRFRKEDDRTLYQIIDDYAPDIVIIIQNTNCYFKQ